MMEYSYVGVDISKAKFDVYHQKKTWSVEQNPEKIQEFIKTILGSTLDKPLLVVCEATGGYEQPLIVALHEAGVHYHIAHPNKVKAFARAGGYRAKTDAIDAKIIAEYAESFTVSPDESLSENRTKIGLLLKRREQLLQVKQAEKKRLDKYRDEGMLKSIQLHIDFLNEQIKEIDKELKSKSKEEDIREDFELLTSIPGIGKVVALMIIANWSEAGNGSNKEMASLIGVAPYNRESGTSKGRQFIQGGRNSVRRMLYMSGLTCIRYSNDMKAFYERLIARGKSVRQALIAVTRKIVCIVNSVMKRRTAWVADVAELKKAVS